MKSSTAILEAEIDRLIHEPARLKIMIYLSSLRDADFTNLIYKTKLSRGNLSVQLQKLEEAGYIEIVKEFVHRKPRTMAALSDKGRKALRRYQAHLTSLLAKIPK